MNPEQEKYELSSSFVATVTSKCDKSREQPLNLSHYPYFYLLISSSPSSFAFAQLFGVKGVKEVKGVKDVSLFP